MKLFACKKNRKEQINEQKMIELLTFPLNLGAGQAAPSAWGNQRSQPSNAPPAANRPGLFFFKLILIKF